MLPFPFESIETKPQDLIPTEKQMHYTQQMESSLCSRPQMALNIYEQMLRIAIDNHQNQSPTSTYKQIDTKRIWLAAFTGPSLSYRSGVIAGVAEPL